MVTATICAGFALCNSEFFLLAAGNQFFCDEAHVFSMKVFA
jgi:hypothetical protein